MCCFYGFWAGAWERNGFSISGKVMLEAAFNSREGVMDRYGLAYMMPTDMNLNQVKMDLNKVSDIRLTARAANLGIAYSKMLGNGIVMTAKADADVLWSSGNNTHILLKQATVSSVIPFGTNGSEVELSLGHGIHPLAEDAPDIFAYGGGAPFNPLGYAPHFSIKGRFGKIFSVKAAALAQSEYPGNGPEGVSTNYIKYSMIPEAFLDLRIENRGWTAALGADYLLTKPRLKGTYPFTDVTIFVNDRLDALCGYSFLRYCATYGNNILDIKGKSIYNRGMTHLNMYGGYAIRDVSDDMAMRYYCSVNSISAWLNASFGGDFKGHVFGGYLQNLGSDYELYSTSPVYFTLDISNVNYLWRAGGALSWNWKNLVIALEYAMTRVYYGDAAEIDPADCLCKKGLRTLDNHGVCLVTSWKF